MAELSLHASQILRALARYTNVLLIGPPATGKSRVMAEIKAAFTGAEPPAYDSKGRAPFPRTGAQKVEDWMPSPTKANRKVFEITFHQGTKHRHFVSGIAPKLSGDTGGFEVTAGILLEANQHARAAQGTALLCIDEINRGPAVSIFGDTLTAIEADKRLDPSNSVVTSSAPFYAHSSDGKFGAHYLSPHLYLLASMNEADTSVEPLDVAFLRRFFVYRLNPDPKVAAEFLGIDPADPVPDTPETGAHVYSALWRAWGAVNVRLSLGRSPAFQIGHGVLMRETPPKTLPDALTYAADGWRRIEAHVDEVFFGNDSARAVVYNAGEKTAFQLKEAYFGDQPVAQLWRDNSADLYKLLVEVGRTLDGA